VEDYSWQQKQEGEEPGQRAAQAGARMLVNTVSMAMVDKKGKDGKKENKKEAAGMAISTCHKRCGQGRNY